MGNVVENNSLLNFVYLCVCACVFYLNSLSHNVQRKRKRNKSIWLKTFALTTVKVELAYSVVVSVSLSLLLLLFSIAVSFPSTTEEWYRIKWRGVFSTIFQFSSIYHAFYNFKLRVPFAHCCVDLDFNYAKWCLSAYIHAHIPQLLNFYSSQFLCGEIVLLHAKVFFFQFKSSFMVCMCAFEWAIERVKVQFSQFTLTLSS